jgi:hypothetical protein
MMKKVVMPDEKLKGIKGSFGSSETECGMLDRKLANMTIGILVYPLNAIKTNGYDT